MNRRLRLIPDWLKRLLSAPVAELSRWQYAVRFFLELCRQGVVQLGQDRASQMAAALAFRTLFGLIPVLIIVILLFRAFGGADLFSDLVDQVLVAARLNDVISPDKNATLAVWARDAIHSIDALVSARAIGLIGGLVLGWAAISLLTTIERSFNAVCQAPEHRSLSRRIPLYWTTITIGPALLYLSFRVESRIVDFAVQAGGGERTAAVVGMGVALLSTWLFLIILYVLMPNTRVPLHAVAIGSFVASVCWQAATGLFGWYISWSFSRHSTGFTILYGSLGLIPLFMFWVYCLWLVVLYGLEVAVMLQVVGGRMEGDVPVRVEAPPLTDPASVIPIMEVVVGRFQHGEPSHVEQIVEATRFNARAIELILAALADDGLLHRVDDASCPAYALARPPDRITTADLLRVVQRLTDRAEPEDSRGWNWVRRFREAQLALGIHRPMAEL